MPTQSQPKVASSIAHLLPVFQAMLPASVLQDLVRAAPGRFYERLFTPRLVVWGFIFQRLNPDHSCDAFVSRVAGGEVDGLDDLHPQPPSQRIRSQSSAAYCKARQRLPLDVLKGALQHTAQALRDQPNIPTRWLGHPVGLLDGTSLLLRPEPDLKAHYGCHQNQHGQTYWAIMRVVAVFCLYTGTVVAVAEGALRTHERCLARTLFAGAQPGSVFVGDRNFGVFSIVQAARHHGLELVLRLKASQARAVVKRGLKRQLNVNDDIVVNWQPSQKDDLDPEMSAAPIAGRVIYVRLERPGFRATDLYLFTNLLDAQRYTVTRLVALYGRRWHVELNLRYVKSSLDMKLLTGKSVEMIRKELTAGLIAYNLIRGSMAQAAQQGHLAPLFLSFSRCWRRLQDALHTWRCSDASQSLAEHKCLLARLAQCKLPRRPRFRIEPRAKRRLPAVYPNLKGSRDIARQKLIEQLKEPTKS